MLAENASHVFRLVTATACVSSYFLGFQFSAMSVLLTRLLPGPRYYMFYTSLFPLGAIAGVFVGRSVMNWKGRRAALIVGNLIGSIGCVAWAAYANLYLLAVGRVIWGIGTGIGNISAPFYIKEIIPVTVSSRYLLWFHLCITLGDFSPFFLFAGHASWEWWWRFIFALPLLPNAA
jgi:MFS family permease